jgi:hypothetical protein
MEWCFKSPDEGDIDHMVESAVSAEVHIRGPIC